MVTQLESRNRIAIMRISRRPFALLALALSACASGGFQITAAEQEEADEAATLTEMAAASAEGLQGTWIQNKHDVATCLWSKSNPRIAVCRSRYRRGDGRWFPSTIRYQRDAEGRWRLAQE